MSETPGSSPENDAAPELPDAPTPTPDEVEKPKRKRAFAVRSGLALVAVVICGAVLVQHFSKSDQDDKDAAGPSAKASAGASPAPSPEAPADACSVLSEKEVSQVLGGVAACSSDPDDPSDAKYTLTGSSFLGDQGSINVSILSGMDTAFFNEYKKQSVADDKSDQVSGLGEDAYYDDKLRSLTMLADGTQYSVQVLGLSDPSGAALQAKEADLLKRMAS